MKKLAMVLALAVTAAVVFVSPVYAAKADFPVTDLFDDFNRSDADKDLSGGENSDGKTVWWSNWDDGTSIDGDALKMTGETHFGAGINMGVQYPYLVLRVKGDATGVLVAPGGKAVKFEDLKGADGKGLPTLKADYQDWVIDIEKSGLSRDQGLHINVGGGTLWVDEIYYADSQSEASADVAEAAEEFPDTALVDDFDRAADEADNSGGVNSEGRDTWWYNAYDYVIDNGALVVTFDADHAHFGMGANVPSEAEYPYLVMRVHGVEGGDYSGLLLNLGASNPVLFSDMKTPEGNPLPKIGTDWVDLVIDMKASGIVFDQGFHMNSDTVGTLYIDKIYYAKYYKTPAASAADNPNTGDSALPFAGLASVIIIGAAVVFASKRKAR